MACDDTDRDAKWDTLRMELIDTLAVSELPDTSMTCATLRALLDILSIKMTRGEAKSLIANSLNARLGSSGGVGHPPMAQRFAPIEFIHHPVERRMAAVLDLDPTIKPAAAVRAVAVLSKPTSPAPSGRHGERGSAARNALRRR